jgi:hypothetical protein
MTSEAKPTDWLFLPLLPVFLAVVWVAYGPLGKGRGL